MEDQTSSFTTPYPTPHPTPVTLIPSVTSLVKQLLDHLQFPQPSLTSVLSPHPRMPSHTPLPSPHFPVTSNVPASFYRGDNELLCSLHNSLCPKCCHCLLFAVTCKTVIFGFNISFWFLSCFVCKQLYICKWDFCSSSCSKCSSLELSKWIIASHVLVFTWNIIHFSIRYFNKVSFICIDCFKI